MWTGRQEEGVSEGAPKKRGSEKSKKAKIIKKIDQKGEKSEINNRRTEIRHIPAKTSREWREEGVPVGAPKKMDGNKSKKRKKNRENRPKCPKKRKKSIKGQKLITYLQKCRGSGERRVFQYVHLTKKGGDM